MKLDLKKKYQRISNNVIGGEGDRGMRLEDIWKKRRMVELGLDPTNQDFLPDNDTVYVDEGQFTSSSILHLHLFAMLFYIVQPHMFIFKSSFFTCVFFLVGVLRVIFLDYVLPMDVFALCFCLDSFVYFVFHKCVLRVV